jgi:hypothetical protein
MSESFRALNVASYVDSDEDPFSSTAYIEYTEESEHGQNAIAGNSQGLEIVCNY